MNFNLDGLVRENVKRLVPYSSARDEFAGAAEIYLDANENSFGSPVSANYNRYPDPYQTTLKSKLAELKGVDPSQIFVGNGSDEAIDLLIRIFCRPQIDNIMIFPPTYGMYEIAAAINDVAVKRVDLTDTFRLDLFSAKSQIDSETKLAFVCSPNNPTGNLMERNDILSFARSFNGIVVVDEAYIDFAEKPSLIQEIGDLPNLIVLQTFSKAWGLAGLRVGLAYANTDIINLLNKIKPPYNVSSVSQEIILQAFGNKLQFDENVSKIISERERLRKLLSELSFVLNEFGSDANFLLVKVHNAKEAYDFLIGRSIVVRDRGSLRLCEGCLRITVGTEVENSSLVEALKIYEESIIY